MDVFFSLYSLFSSSLFSSSFFFLLSLLPSCHIHSLVSNFLCPFKLLPLTCFRSLCWERRRKKERKRKKKKKERRRKKCSLLSIGFICHLNPCHLSCLLGLVFFFFFSLPSFIFLYPTLISYPFAPSLSITFSLSLPNRGMPITRRKERKKSEK